MMKKFQPKLKLAGKSRTRPVLAIDGRLDELRKLEISKTGEILAREKLGETTGETGPVTVDIDAEAFALLAGEAAAKVRQPPTASLDALFRERVVIRRAIELGEQIWLEQHGERVRAEVAERMDEYRQRVRNRALAVIELRRQNRELAEFCDELRGPGGLPNLPCMGFTLLGAVPVVGDEVYRFLDSVTRSGIMTKLEISDHE